MTIEQYIKEQVEEFSQQHFDSFYQDVLHREYTLDKYLEEDDLFDEHIKDLGNYDFIELRNLLGISKKTAIGITGEDMGDKIRDRFRKAVEMRFREGLEFKVLEIKEDLLRDDLSNRELLTLKSQKNVLEKEISRIKQTINEK